MGHTQLFPTLESKVFKNHPKKSHFFNICERSELQLPSIPTELLRQKWTQSPKHGLKMDQKRT